MTTPGRTCPLRYRYPTQALARSPDFEIDTAYVVGGRYGNRPAVEAILRLRNRETGAVDLVFNGDFNWLNVDAEGFEAVTESVLELPCGRGAVFNNGAADLPNFRESTYGLITRISERPARGLPRLYGTRVDRVYVDAVPVHYDHEAWHAQFLASWPPGSEAFESYVDRIRRGPPYDVAAAARGVGTC